MLYASFCFVICGMNEDLRNSGDKSGSYIGNGVSDVSLPTHRESPKTRTMSGSSFKARSARGDMHDCPSHRDDYFGASHQRTRRFTLRAKAGATLLGPKRQESRLARGSGIARSGTPHHPETPSRESVVPSLDEQYQIPRHCTTHAQRTNAVRPSC